MKLSLLTQTLQGSATREVSPANAWRFYDDAKPEGVSSRADVGVLANMIKAQQNPSVFNPENDARS